MPVSKLTNNIKVFGVDPGFTGAIAGVILDTLTGKATIDSVYDLPTKMYVKDPGYTKKGKPRAVKCKPRKAYNLQLLLPYIKKMCPAGSIVFVESNLVLAGDSHMTIAKTAFGAGLILGLCYASGCDVRFAMPREWQACIHTHDMDDAACSVNHYARRKATKNKSLKFVDETFGHHGVALVKTSRGRYLDGRADAICIAMYGARVVAYGDGHYTKPPHSWHGPVAC